MNNKRSKVEAFVLKIITTQDPSLYNTNLYKTFFESLDDEAFDAWMKTLKDNPHAKLTLMVPPFKVVISTDSSFATAKLLGIDVFERLKLWDSVNKRYCMTSEKYLVLKLPVRRLKQYLMDGLSVPEDDKRLNPLTDQVTGPSKGSAISFPQAQMIAEKGLETTLQELMTIRGGDLEAWSRMKSEIEESGDSDTSVMVGTGGTRASQTLNSFINALHLVSNI